MRVFFDIEVANSRLIAGISVFEWVILRIKCIGTRNQIVIIFAKFKKMEYLLIYI